jgi:hypothetical protein
MENEMKIVRDLISKLVGIRIITNYILMLNSVFNKISLIE